MRPAAPTCARLATLNSQLYGVDVAASKCTRPADACGKVGSRNGGGGIGLGGEQCEEGDRIVRRTLAHILNICTVDYTESM
jgi:hypothetical protein